METSVYGTSQTLPTDTTEPKCGQANSCAIDKPSNNSKEAEPTEIKVVESGESPSSQSHVVIALQSADEADGPTNTSMPLSKETFVEFGHTEAEAETISQIFIEVCSAESMGLFSGTQSNTDEQGSKETRLSTGQGDTTDEDTAQFSGYKVLMDQCVQVNDYEIERSGKLPARRRIVPYKFRDYRNPDLDNENGDDSDYDPEDDFLPVKRRRGVGRGKDAVSSPDVENESRPGNRGRVRGRRGRGRGGYRKGRGFSCPECDKVFSQKGNLTVHLRIHKGERPFACDWEGCGKEFRTNETLRRHKLSHLGIKPFECEVCQKKFSCNVSLREHMSIHNDLKPYKCDKCEKTFRHISTLSRHMTVHSTETPYSCEDCGKQFSQMAYLKSHQRVHTGIKPYGCEECGRKFSHQSDLNRHKVIHTGLKPYVCDICNARFTDPSSRRRHIKEHVGNKPFPCELCGDEFKRAGQLKVHLNRVHNSFSEPTKLNVPGDKGAIQLMYRDMTAGTISSHMRKASELKTLSTENKIVRLISSLNNTEPVQQISILGQPQMSVCQGNEIAAEVSVGTPEAECEQILIEAAQAGEVTVQTMGEQLIVTSLPESSDGTVTVHHPEVQLEQHIVQTEASSQVSLVQQASNISHTTSPRQMKSSSSSGNEGMSGESKMSIPDEGIEHQEDPVEYMYEIIEDIDGDAQQQVVEIQCQTDQPLVTVSKSSETTVTENEQDAGDQESGTADSENPEALSAVDYVRNPDFSSQGYYNWLSNFTELCKLVPMPLDVDLFQKISQVHKTLSDVMATPSGVLSIRENYKILMSITKDLNIIINEHLSFVLDNLDNTKESS